MGSGREHAFAAALTALRAQLRQGAFPPGARIPASRLAAAMRLSPTPVREALCHLAGEGLVEERRLQGFFVRPLSGLDIADLHRLRLAQLLILAEPARLWAEPRDPAPPPPDDPIEAVEALFADWVDAAGSASLAVAHRAVSGQLAPVRRLEARIFADLAAEAAELRHLAGGVPAFAAAVRRFHDRRIQAADRLAAALNLSRPI